MSGIGHNSAGTPGNWIAVSRDMRDHPVVGMGNNVKPEDPSRGSFSKYEAWQDLLMEAKWKPFDVNNKGKVVNLSRGQLMAARAWLARRWNWSEKTVRTFLAKLESELMVRNEQGQSKGQRSGHYANVLTICNYDIYQTISELDDMTKGQSKGQSGASQGPVAGQSGANQGPHNNKETNTQRSAHEWPEGDFVEANGEAIYVSLLGKRRKFEYAAIDQWAALGMCAAGTARKIVEAEARGWVTDQQWPDVPSRWLQKQIASWRTHRAIADIRLENERQRGAQQPRKSWDQQRQESADEWMRQDIARRRESGRGPMQPRLDDEVPA